MLFKHFYLGISMAEIARHIGVGASAIGTAIRKNIFKGSKYLFKNKFSLFLTIIIPLCFLGSIIALGYYKVLPLKDVVNNLAIFIGWIVALLIVWIQITKTREDNNILKREEIKKSLEINAFKEINTAVTSFSNTLIKTGTEYHSLKSKLNLHISSPHIFAFPKNEIELKISQDIIQLYNAVADFSCSIETNEIAVIKFDHLRKFIQYKVYDAIDLLVDFQQYLANTNILKLKTTQNQQYNKLCDDIFQALTNAAFYLFDYRIEIMNYFMGDIFTTKVPRRKPGDPNVKTLIKVAIKKEVEKEERNRLGRYLKPKI